MVTGMARLISGTPSTVNVPLTGSAAFTSATSYLCSLGNITNSGGTAFVTRTSGSAFTLTGGNLSTDQFFFVCVGS